MTRYGEYDRAAMIRTDRHPFAFDRIKRVVDAVDASRALLGSRSGTATSCFTVSRQYVPSRRATDGVGIQHR